MDEPFQIKLIPAAFNNGESLADAAKHSGHREQIENRPLTIGNPNAEALFQPDGL